MPSTPQQKLMYLQRKYPGILEDAENMSKEDFIQKHRFSVGYVSMLAALFRSLFPEKNFLFFRLRHKGHKKGESHPWSLHKKNIDDKYPGIMAAMAKMNNIKVADKYGISRERVRQLRLRFSIPAPNNDIIWTEEHIKLLGKQPDLALARQWGMHNYVVRRKRLTLGIPAYNTEDRYAKLRPFEDLVGKVSDRKLSRMANVNWSIVADFRKEKGIPPYHLSPMCEDFQPVDLAEMERLLLAGAPDEEIAEKTGRTVESIRNIRRKKLRLFRDRNTKQIYRPPTAD